MRSWRVVPVVCLLFQLCAAQDFPVEIELVLPSESQIPFTVITAVKPTRPALPTWFPPARPCPLCAELKTERGCSCSLLLTQELAVSLLQTVEDALSEASGERIKLVRRVSVRAVSRQRLIQMGGEPLLGLYEDDVIWVSHDLNRRQATAVIAHEMGHAWFFQRRAEVDSPNELLFEGFAEFVSYLVLRHLGDHQAAQRIEQHDSSVYGRGARILIGKFRRLGLDAVLELALKGQAI